MAIRAEDLHEWICFVTKQPVEAQHLSLVLQNGQLLCELANALDGNAQLKINKLSTVFHSKSNLNSFLQWCASSQGLHPGQLFEPEDVLDDSRDFTLVLNTLSILYERFEGGRFSQQRQSDTPTTSSPIKKSKLTAFMSKGTFLSNSKKNPTAASTTPLRSSEGTPPQSPEGTPPGSPRGTPPGSPRCSTPVSPSMPHRSSGGGATNSKLNAFLNQVPPSRAVPLEHAKRPAGPKKRSVSRKESKQSSGFGVFNVNSPNSPPPMPQPPVVQANEVPSVGSADDPRNKFAQFMRSHPPGGGPPQPLVLAPTKLQEPSSPQASSAKPSTVMSPKSIQMESKVSGTASTSNNKLMEFMKKQPPTAAPAPSLSSSQQPSRLQAFLENSQSVPGVTESTPTSTPSISQPVTSQRGTKATTRFPKNRTVVSQKLTVNARFPFTPRRLAKRSTCTGSFVRRRQTYWSSGKGQASSFSLEEKRKEFMREQLLLKEEERERQLQGDKNPKHNLIVPGVQCYVPDREDVWLLSEVMDYNERSKQVKIQVFADDGTKDTRVVDLKDPDMINAIAGPNAKEIESLPIAIRQDTMEGIEDMRLLRYLNEPSILFNLKLRFECSKPYTYSNDIVIAVNPYKWIADLYGDNLHEQYLQKHRDTLPPHVYATSTAAYKHMKKNEVNQSILVSGESGAGKTETTKIVMNHLASVAGGRNDKTIARVIEVNPLLESFGNARTTRNDNSSRFGKFTQLQFNQRGKLIGAKCETYLLEKSRVVSIANGERNYHIFYQMLSGLLPKDLKTLKLERDYPYHYTGALSEMKIDGTDDAKLLESTKRSLTLIGLDGHWQKVLFQILAGIMHLGEVKFEASGENGSKISNMKQLAYVAEMFGVPESSIQKAFCNRTVITRNDCVTVPLDSLEAEQNRDALAKTIYSQMFDWLVTKINDALGAEESATHGRIGVLDIFGFEDFAHNGFEQFCINYANEKLQQKFTTDVFKTVEDEYIREGLQWDHIEYQDNQEIVEIIDGKMGIIALMNDHLRQPRGTEEALVNKFKTNHHMKGDVVSPHIDFPKVKRTQFIINHYAGSVTYETIGFMEKHRDTLQKDLLDLIQSSEVSLLTDFFTETDYDDGSTKNKAASKSLGAQFKRSLTSLMENITSTNTHYIRCIKPNSHKSSTEFNKKMVVEQLRSAGVIEAIRITRSGYPSRLTPKELATRYCIMFPPSMRSSDDNRTCTVFMNAIGRKSPLEYQIGKTMVYLKTGVLEELEAMKSDFLYIEATCIQKIVLGFIERRRFQHMLQAAIMIQSVMRMGLEKREYFLKRRSIICIQRAWIRYVNTPVDLDDMDGDTVGSESSEESLRVSDHPKEQWNLDSPVKPLSMSFDLEPQDENKENFGLNHDKLRLDGKRSPLMERIRSLKSSMRRSVGSHQDTIVLQQTSSIRRMEDLSEKARKLIMNSNSAGMSLEEENEMLRRENHNLRYDLELMREQCIELQSIILEINRSRKDER